MRVSKIRRMDIELHNEEVEALGNIIKLAHEKLEESELIQMLSLPIQKQAGLCGPALFRVKKMIEELAEATDTTLECCDKNSQVSGSLAIIELQD